MSSARISNAFGLVSRPALLFLLLTAPVFALPSAPVVPANIIEAPAPKSTGLGFVLTVILQKR